MNRLATRLAIALMLITGIVVICAEFFYPGDENTENEETVYLENAYSGEQCSCVLKIKRSFEFASFFSGCGCLRPEFLVSESWVSGSAITQADSRRISAIKFLVAVSALPSQQHGHSLYFFNSQKQIIKKYNILYTAKSRTHVLSDYVVSIGNVITGDPPAVATIYVYNDKVSSRHVKNITSTDERIRCKYSDSCNDAPVKIGYEPVGRIEVQVDTSTARNIYSDVTVEDSNGVQASFRVQGSICGAVSASPEQCSLPRHSSSGPIYESKHTVRTRRGQIKSLVVGELPSGVSVSIDENPNKVSYSILLKVNPDSDIVTKGEQSTIPLAFKATTTDGALHQLILPLRIN